MHERLVAVSPLFAGVLPPHPGFSPPHSILLLSTYHSSHDDGHIHHPIYHLQNSTRSRVLYIKYVPPPRTRIMGLGRISRHRESQRVFSPSLFFLSCAPVSRSSRLSVFGTAVHNAPCRFSFSYRYRRSRPWNRCPRGVFSWLRFQTSSFLQLSCYQDDYSVLAAANLTTAHRKRAQ